MTDNKDKVQIEPTPQDRHMHAMRSACLDFAIRSSCGQTYDEEGRVIVEEDWIIGAAKKFESFIRNGDVPEVKPEPNPIISLIKNDKSVEKKEGW